MKERPILFSAPMVRAILAGTKTQTRRVVKPQPVPVDPRNSRLPGLYRNGDFAWRDKGAPLGCVTISCKPNGPDGWAAENSPYGQPGDRLWVRETFRRDLDRLHSRKLIEYAADDEVRDAGPSAAFDFPDIGWRPSIHMPRWASRITLEITGVRVEQLHQISEDDAISEGVERTVTGDGWRRYCDADMELAGVPPVASARQSYFTLWNQIHGHGTWTENPWVWVVEFKRVEGGAA